jgi:putative ABC transport system permease protein
LRLRELALAWRNLLRHGRRTAWALAAIAVGVTAVIFSDGFVEWILWAARETTIHAQLGHLQVTKQGYFEEGVADPFAYLMEENGRERDALERLEGARVIAPRLSFTGLASRGEATLSFMGEGVVPEREAAINRAHRLRRAAVNIVAGADLSSEERYGIVMGEGLAANLDAKVGDRITLLANTKTGGINAVEVTLLGIFSTISKAFDDSALRVPLATAQELLRVSGSHRLVVLLERTEATDEALAHLRQSLAGSRAEVTPWYSLADFYNKTAALFTRQTAVVRLAMAFIIVLSIGNTLMMNVSERTGEIGTSLALGVPRRQILSMFVMEAAVLGAIGGAAGVLCGMLLAWAVSAIGVPMPPPPGQSWGYSAEITVNARIAAQSFVLAFAAALIASAYPAWRAARLPIVDALRHNR